MSELNEQLVRLVQAAELLEISYVDLRATRSEGFSDGDGEAAEEVQPTYTLGFERSADQERFRVRLKVEISAVFGVVVAEASAEYKRAEFPHDELTDAVLLDYSNDVAVVALLPYLRQAIADLTQRVFGSPLLMPALQRGAVTFSMVGA